MRLLFAVFGRRRRRDDRRGQKDAFHLRFTLLVLDVVLLTVLVAMSVAVPSAGWSYASIAAPFVIFFASWEDRVWLARTLALILVIALFVTGALGFGSVSSFLGDALFSAIAINILSLRAPRRTAEFNVLIVSRHDPQLMGGTETFTRNLFRTVAAELPSAMLTYVHFNEGRAEFEAPGVQVFRRRGSKVFDYLRRHEAEMFTLSPLSALVMGLVAIELGWIALRAPAATKANVIYAVGGPIAAIAGIVAGLVLGKPVVAHFHYDYFFSRLTGIKRQFLRAAFSKCAFIIANSEAGRRDLEAFGLSPERLATVHHWVFARDFEQVEPDRGLPVREDGIKRALFLGRLVPEKGIDIVLDALPQFPSNIQLVIVGDGDRADRVRIAQDRFSEKRLLWLGEQPHARVPSIIKACDFVVWGAIDVEYLSFSAIEALACGVPVVAPNKSSNAMGRLQEVNPNTLPEQVGVLTDIDPLALAVAVSTISRREDGERSVRCRRFVADQYGPANFEKIRSLWQRASDSF